MLSIDIETKDPELLTKGPGEFREDTYIVGVSISDGVTSEYYSLRHYNTSAEEREKNLKILRDRLCVPGEMKIGANILYDLTYLIHKEGIPVTGPFYDILIAEPLIYEHSFSYSLDSCAKKYLGIEKEKDEITEWCVANGKKLTAKQRPASYIWEMPSWVVEGYAKADALLPFKIREKQISILEREELLPVFELEMGLFPLYLKMRKNGVRIDKNKAKEGIALCQQKVENGWETIRKLYGEINLNSYAQVAKLFNKFGLETGRTAKGAETANKKHFLKYKDVPVVGAILDVKEYGKTQKDFLEAGILEMAVADRIRSSYHPLRSDSGGTVSGRYSCIAVDTYISTTKGKKKIQDITDNDYVFTHLGNIAKVEKLLDKGKQACMHISKDRTEIVCTADHLFFVNNRWVKAEELENVSKHYTIKKHCTMQESDRDVHIKRETLGGRSSKGDRCFCSNSKEDDISKSNCGKVKGRESIKVFKKEIWKRKPYEQDERRKSSFLERTLFRSQRIFHTISRWCKVLISQSSSGKGNRNTSKENAVTLRSASHRRESCKQQHRQPGIGDKQRPSFSTPKMEKFRMQENTLGQVQVYDIMLSHEDHSFIANGFPVHNCSTPNQQQIPSRHEVLGTLCRSVFIPEQGEKWLSCDFSGQELRIFAHYATGRGANDLRRKYQDDPLMDFHQEISDLTGLDRKASKTISLGSLYGMGWRTLGENNGWDEEYSRAIYEEYHSRVPMVKESLYSAQNVMERRGYIKTILGRRARLKNKDKAFVALNRVIQGSAADQCKKSMLDAYNAGIFDVLTMLSTIHDEINVSMPLNKEGIEAGIELKNIMERAVSLEVPMISSLEMGDNWGSLKKYSSVEEFRNVLYL